MPTTRAKLKTALKRATKSARPKQRSLRVEARITPENLAVIKRAAEIQGRAIR